MLKRLNILYYSFFALYLATIALFYFGLSMNPVDQLFELGQGIQYGVITYMLISVPGALYFFKRYMKKVSKIEDEKAREAAYLRAAELRLVAICLGVILALAAFYLLGQNRIVSNDRNSYSMLWCAGISLIAQVFCKPNAKKIYMEMNDLREDDPKMGEI